jgi:hypothetical protein
MTPTDEATFIALWTQGLEVTVIAQRLGIPRGTVSSRAAALVRQGKIQRRPRGGTYPSQRASARQPLALSNTTETGPVQTSVHNPVQTHAPSLSTVHRPVHTSPDHPPPSPDLSGMLSALVERLSAIEETLKHGGCICRHRCRSMHPCRHMHCQGSKRPGCPPRSGNRSDGISTCPGGFDSVSNRLRPLRGSPPANFYNGCVAPGRRPGKTPKPTHEPPPTLPLPLLRYHPARRTPGGEAARGVDAALSPRPASS